MLIFNPSLGETSELSMFLYDDSGDFWEAWNYSKALQFGKNEVYRHRRA